MSMKSGSKFFVRNLITAHPTHIHRYVLCDFLIKEFWHYLQFILFVLFPLLKKSLDIYFSTFMSSKNKTIYLSCETKLSVITVRN